MCGLNAFDGVDVDDNLAHCLVNDELRFVNFVLDADHQIHHRDVKQQIDENGIHLLLTASEMRMQPMMMLIIKMSVMDTFVR